MRRVVAQAGQLDGDLDPVRRNRRVGALVIVPAEDRPILRTTRLGVAAVGPRSGSAR